VIKTPVALALTALIALVIAYGTLSPPGEGSGLPFTDKQLHFAAFAVLVLPLNWVRPGWWASMAVTALLYGGAIELLQPMVGRTAEWGDLLADGLGIITGLIPGLIRARKIGITLPR